MLEAKQSEVELYQKRLNEIREVPSYLVDRLDNLKGIATDVETALETHTEHRDGWASLSSFLTGVLMYQISPLGAAVAFAAVLYGTKKVYEKFNEVEITFLRNIQRDVEQETKQQIDNVAKMSENEIAGLEKYDDLITKHPEIANVLSKAFRNSVKTPPIQEQKIATRQPGAVRTDTSANQYPAQRP